jgi:hypothetical protein
MTLGNMRQNGVRGLNGGRHQAVVEVERLVDDVEGPSIGPPLPCQGCGARGVDARPNWSERRAR